MRPLFISLILVFLLTGCSSVGNEAIEEENQVSIKEKLVKGETTKSEVKELFGDPLDATFNADGNEMWRYEFTTASCNVSCYFIYTAWAYRSSSGVKKTLTILFDDSDIVEKYILSESEIEEESGLFAG